MTFVVLLALCLLTLPAQAALYSGGGTAEDPFIIDTAAKMNDIGNNPGDWDKHFKLTADIDLGFYTGEMFNIIGFFCGYGDPNNRPFTGVFDGNGHTISNFTYSTSERQIGIFGYVEGAEFKNVGLINPDVDAGTTGWRIGALVGDMKGGTVTGCYVEGGSISGDWQVGGLIGLNNYGELTMSDCYATCSVCGTESVGGLISGCYWGTVTNCYATGKVFSSRGGGLIGTSYAGSHGTTTISRCYATGNVVGNGGGLVEENLGLIYDSYATGRVTGSGGGLVASNSGTVENSFWDKETSGKTTSAAGTGKTTAQMKDASTFLNAGWDFVGETANGTDDIWAICSCGGCYPRLVENMEIPSLLGDSVVPEGVDINDLAFFVAHWLESDCAGQYWTSGPCGADLNGNGTVDLEDYAVTAANWLVGLPVSGPPGMFYNFTLDTDPGWTVEGEWAFGQPAGLGGSLYGNPDPSSGYTGTNVYGVDLYGDYDPIQATGPFYLTTGPLDCSGYDIITLKFARWLNSDEYIHVRNNIKVSANGSSWHTVWSHSGAPITDSTWQLKEYDITYPASRQETIYIRWGYQIYDPHVPPEPILPYSGWNIDDIQLWGN